MFLALFLAPIAPMDPPLKVSKDGNAVGLTWILGQRQLFSSS